MQLRYVPAAVLAEANERRSQAENYKVALFRLRVNLALDVRCPIVEPSEPSCVWKSHLKGNRIEVAVDHADFPALLAEGLDTLAACDGDVRRAASRLHTTASQLARLVGREARAFSLLNRWRSDRGLRPLRPR